jgi:uncharacterized membrane protein
VPHPGRPAEPPRGAPQEGGHVLPAWLRPTAGEHRWPAALAVLAAIAMQLALPTRLALQPVWLLPGIELALLLVLAVADPGRVNRESTVLRLLGLAIVAVAFLATAWSVNRLVVAIASGAGRVSPPELLINGGMIWLTNVIVFALWFWELDRGGPAARANARHAHPDFLFAQMTAGHLARHDWEPGFVDYLYLAFTNATAFSPTDTLPLTRWAKLTMMFQAGVSFVVVLLVIARAVNVLT